MNHYRPNEIAKRLPQIDRELTALKEIHGDFKTLNMYRTKERMAIRVLIEDLQAEQLELINAMKENRILTSY